MLRSSFLAGISAIFSPGGFIFRSCSLSLPLVKMYPVFLMAALTGCLGVLCRVAESDDRVRDHGIGQDKKLPLALHLIHLRSRPRPH